MVINTDKLEDAAQSTGHEKQQLIKEEKHQHNRYGNNKGYHLVIGETAGECSD